jgi:hypothetical protein
VGCPDVRRGARPRTLRIWEGDVRGAPWFGGGRLNQGMLLLCGLPGGQCLSNALRQPNKVELIKDGFKGIPDNLDRVMGGKVSGVKLVAHPGETPAV